MENTSNIIIMHGKPQPPTPLTGNLIIGTAVSILIHIIARVTALPIVSLCSSMDNYQQVGDFLCSHAHNNNYLPSRIHLYTCSYHACVRDNCG